MVSRVMMLAGAAAIAALNPVDPRKLALIAPELRAEPEEKLLFQLFAKHCAGRPNVTVIRVAVNMLVSALASENPTRKEAMAMFDTVAKQARDGLGQCYSEGGGRMRRSPGLVVPSA